MLLVAALTACGGGGGGDGGTPTVDGGTSAATASTFPTLPTVAIPAPAPNVLQVVLDRGPQGSAFNTPFVSVTLCVPGTEVCQTLDHIVLDTASHGLRVIASALRPELALPAVTVAATAGAAPLPAAECMPFASGYAWGSLRKADLAMAGERAAGMTIQVIGDRSAPYATVPAACTRNGRNLAGLLDANGILGVGPQKLDCGAACATSASPSVYFACGTGGCTSTRMTLEAQVANPVPSLPVNNNGLMVVLPQVPIGGTGPTVGAVVFGVGTQANNQIGTATVIGLDPQGFFTTQYKGVAYAAFLDTGSNGIYFPDAQLATCGGLYCPILPAPRSATITSALGASAAIDFLVDSPFWLIPEAAAAHLGGSDGAPLSLLFNWGLPFFFGRAVHLAIQDATTPAGRGPYWAF
ncbi:MULTISPECIES: DUF3443 family protein [Ramlibacter]|uniref:DUF3443 family protein n=1 Tax=Ramlibacter TaxID=174951 RepID=UPI0012F9A538|nr:DUF3443 family protein [Ramlibacter sp. CGMCC 1.13660]